MSVPWKSGVGYTWDVEISSYTRDHYLYQEKALTLSVRKREKLQHVKVSNSGAV